MGTGFLVARVFTSRSAIPIEDVSISIVSEHQNGKELNGFRSTDGSGNTTSVALPAPDRGLSEQPSQIQPFSVYRLQADHPSYKSVVVRNIQIFDGATSVQNIELLPLQENASSGERVEIFPVSPQDL